MTDDEQQIRTLIEGWAEAVHRGDLAGVVSDRLLLSHMLPKLKDLSALARRVGVRVFYSVQTGFDVAKEEAGVWVRIRMKRAKASDPNELLKEKEDPHDREIIAELKPQPQDIVFQ